MIIPAGHKVLIQPKEVEKYVGVIEVVQDEQRALAATTEGTVIALGETAYLKVDDGRPWCKPGDYVLYAKYAGAGVKDPETKKDYVVVHDVDIVCIIKDQKGEQHE